MNTRVRTPRHVGTPFGAGSWRGWVAAAAASVGAAALAPSASAQISSASENERLTPPTPGKPDTPPAITNYLTIVVIVGAVVGASLIPSKRGHQD